MAMKRKPTKKDIDSFVEGGEKQTKKPAPVAAPAVDLEEENAPLTTFVVPREWHERLRLAEFKNKRKIGKALVVKAAEYLSKDGVAEAEKMVDALPEDWKSLKDKNASFRCPESLKMLIGEISLKTGIPSKHIMAAVVYRALMEHEAS